MSHLNILQNKDQIVMGKSMVELMRNSKTDFLPSLIDIYMICSYLESHKSQKCKLICQMLLLKFLELNQKEGVHADLESLERFLQKGSIDDKRVSFFAQPSPSPPVSL
jgi:type III secretory pathway component EscU